MNLLYIGKLVNTHGIKGEVRILSDFKYKEDVFKIGNTIYINNIKYTINSYRKHKNYDMLTLNNINSIEDANNLKGLSVYIDKNDYKFDGYLNEDLIGLDVYDNGTYKGKVIDVWISHLYDILVIDGKRRHLVPNIPTFVKNVDLEKKIININYIRWLDLED